MSLLRKLLAENSIKPSVITYTATDGNIITPKDGVFLDAAGNQAKVVSNTYENGQGKMEFDRGVYLVNNPNDNTQWTTLKTIDLDDSIKVIYNEAFANATNLEKIRLPNYLEKLYGYLFHSDKLTELKIPETTNYIVSGAIVASTNISKLEIAENDIYKSDSNCIIKKNTKALIVGCAKSVIPDYVEKIAYQSFVYQNSLTNLNIGKNVKQISNGAFWGSCQKLTGITVDDTNSFFYMEGNCLIRNSDKAVIFSTNNNPYIPTDIEILGESSFFGRMSLKNIKIPQSVKKIERYAFYCCNNLNIMMLYPETPPLLGNFALLTGSSLEIYVPDSSVDSYKAADGWSSYADIIQAIPSE